MLAANQDECIDDHHKIGAKNTIGVYQFNFRLVFVDAIRWNCVCVCLWVEFTILTALSRCACWEDPEIFGQ